MSTTEQEYIVKDPAAAEKLPKQLFYTSLHRCVRIRCWSFTDAVSDFARVCSLTDADFCAPKPMNAPGSLQIETELRRGEGGVFDAQAELHQFRGPFFGTGVYIRECPGPTLSLLPFDDVPDPRRQSRRELTTDVLFSD